MSILGIWKHWKIVFFFGDDEDMDRCLGIDIPESQNFIIFKDNIGRYFFSNNLIENCFLPLHILPNSWIK